MAALGVDLRVVRLGSAGGLVAPLRAAAGDRRPMQALLYERRRAARRVADVVASAPFDLVHGLLVRSAPFVPASGPPVVLDFVDALSVNLAARGRRDRPLARRAARWEARRISAYERELLGQIDAGIVVSEQDRAALGSPPGLRVVPNGVADQFFDARAERRPGRVLFAGNLGYFPNVDAARWLAREIFPLVRSRHPEATLRLVGARPAPTVRRLARLPGVELIGEVDDMAVEVAAAAVVVAPLRAGSGIQNKVLEAMAAGTPVVTMPGVADTLGLLPGRHVATGSNAFELADAAATLLADPAGAAAMGATAREQASARFRWSRAAAAVEEIWESVRRS